MHQCKAVLLDGVTMFVTAVQAINDVLPLPSMSLCVLIASLRARTPCKPPVTPTALLRCLSFCGLYQACFSGQTVACSASDNRMQYSKSIFALGGISWLRCGMLGPSWTSQQSVCCSLPVAWQVCDGVACTLQSQFRNEGAPTAQLVTTAVLLE